MKESEIINVYNKIGFELLNDLTANKNICISSFSIITVLLILLNGMGDNERNEILCALGMDGVDIDELNEMHKDVTDHLKLNVSSGMWAHKEYEINNEFVNYMKNFYEFDMKNIDSEVEKTAKEINEWIKEKTHGKIDGNVTTGMIEKIYVMIINAIYFKCRWIEPFDIKKTKDKNFYLLNGEIVKVPMMDNYETYMYFENETFQSIKIPFNGPTDMYIFLPKMENVDIKKFYFDVFSNLDITKYGLSSAEVRLVFPKFKIQYEKNILKNVLSIINKSIIGIGPHFEKMGKGLLFIEDIIHKTIIDVNEEGTEAAAVTMLRGYSGYEPQKKFYMNVNHPFLFAICGIMGTVLFSGWVFNPAE